MVDSDGEGRREVLDKLKVRVGSTAWDAVVSTTEEGKIRFDFRSVEDAYSQMFAGTFPRALWLRDPEPGPQEKLRVLRMLTSYPARRTFRHRDGREWTVWVRFTEEVGAPDRLEFEGPDQERATAENSDHRPLGGMDDDELRDALEEKLAGD